MNEKRARPKLDPAGLYKALGKHKYVLLVLLVGVLIILWPGGEHQAGPEAPAEDAAAPRLTFSLAAEEQRIATALSQIAGAGEVTVVLSLKTSLEQEVAVDEDASGRRETVTISAGQGVQSEVTLRYRYPEFQGALVVSEGAHNASVRLQLTQAVAALTGLGTDRITVTVMQSSDASNENIGGIEG